jgi:hypothetical protein
MQGINVLAVLISLIAACEVDGLWSLSFLLLNLSFAHSDLHTSFSKGLHWWGCDARFIARIQT